jgi:nucleoside-diphosphate-sugar epimerase
MLVCRNGYAPGHDSEYCPDTFYGESKAEMERIVRSQMDSAKLEYVILRPTSIWGPWFGAPYLQFFFAIRRGVYVHPGNVQVRKQFGFVGNVVNQIMSLLTANADKCSSKMYYVGDYQEYIVRDWADLIQKELGVRRIRTVPLPILRVAAAMGDRLSALGLRRFPLTSFRLRNMLTDNRLPFEKTFRVCGDLEYSISDGVRLTAEWIRNQNI